MCVQESKENNWGKLDIEKAYDHVNWGYLLKVLKIWDLAGNGLD